MEALVHSGLVNAILAGILAVIVAGLAILLRRRPAVVHGLWVLVLVKFLVPSVYPVEIPWWRLPQIQLDNSEQPAVQESPKKILADQTLNLREDVSVEFTNGEPHIGAATNEERIAKLPGVNSRSAVEEDSQTTGETLPPTDPTMPLNSAPRLTQLPWEKLVGFVWLTGSLAWMAVAGFRIIRFQRILRLARPASPATQIRVRRLADQLGLLVCPSVSFVSAPVAPLLWALTRSPRLLIPSQLWERLNEEQRDTLLVHELAHLRRGDHWVRRLEMIVLAIYWWHPVVWWAQRQLREAEEQCCDAWVLWALPSAAQDYAVVLVETLAFLSHSPSALPVGASGIEPMRLLKRRLSMIVKGHPRRGISRLASCSIIGLGLLLLPLLPVPAQQAANPAGDDEEQVQAPVPPQDAPALPQSPTSKPAPAPIAPPMPADRAEQIEAARDQVDLMEAKLMIKQAELEELVMRIRLAQRSVNRLEELFKKGALPESALNKARDEAELLPTQLPTKKAELKEAEIMLKQAQRRLRRVEATEAAPRGKGVGMQPAPTGAPGMIGAPPRMKSKAAPMKPGGGLPPGHASEPRARDGKALPGAPPGSGTPGNKPPGLGSGGPALLGSPGGRGAPSGAPGLPPGPGGDPSANPPSDDAQGVVLNVDANTGLATITIPGDPLRVGAGSRFEAYRLKPNPKYLGKIEILKVEDSIAVGRLTDSARSGSLEKGDLVASKLIGTLAGFEPTPVWASSLFDAKIVQFGTVRRGERVHHMWRVTNTLKEPIHIASMRVSAAFVTAKALVKFDDLEGELMARSDAWIAPHQSIYIYVEVDTGRFAGDKTSAVYVQFDQPSAATVQLQVRVNSQDSPAGVDPKPEPPRDPKAKINELEHQIHQLMMEVDDLRDQLKQPPAKPGAGSSRLEKVPGTEVQRYTNQLKDDPAKP